jgi:ribonuclease J
MKATIHRGAVEVGGSCFELEAATGERLLLDLGLPLSGETGGSEIPRTLGLTDEGGLLLGLVLSHAHPDHYGLMDSLPRRVPVYTGAATARILREASFFTPLGLDRQPTDILEDRRELQIGPFQITPFLVDHSAYDSYALLVSADGRSLFYTGDFRAHGRKAALFEQLIRRPPDDIDVLVLEGTTIGRPPTGDVVPGNEQEVEDRCVELFGRTLGISLACYSPQNVDRLVTVYRAAVRSGRQLVLDLYGASIAAATGRDTIPQADWDSIRVYVPQAQRARVKDSGEFWRVNELGRARIYQEELAADPGRWVMSFRTSMAHELGRAGCLADASAVWLMWAGYLDGEAGVRTREVFRHAGVELELVHASGHARVEDLQRLARAIGATRVVPIHTSAPERFDSLFERVERHFDGERWEV